MNGVMKKEVACLLIIITTINTASIAAIPIFVPIPAPMSAPALAPNALVPLAFNSYSSKGRVSWYINIYYSF